MESFELIHLRTGDWVASRVVCRSGERVTGPVLVHAVKDAEEDAFTTGTGGEGAHGADPAAHLDEESLNHVGGAEPLPVRWRAVEEGQEFLQIGFQAGDGLGRRGLPAGLPGPEAADRLGAVGGLVDEFGFLQAGALGGFEFVFQVAQFVGPAALVGHRGPDPAQGLDGVTELPSGKK